MVNLKSRLRLAKFQPWMLAAMVCFIYIISIYALNDSDPLTFVYLSQEPSADHPEGVTGYDGQFTYAIAIDPLNSTAKLDNPAYRLQRILLPILANILSLGQQNAVPWVILTINCLAYLATIIMLGKLLTSENASGWWVLILGLSAGMLMPVRLGLTEPLAYALVTAAILLEKNKRDGWSAALFGLAGLAKEQTLIFVIGYMLWFAYQRQWRNILSFGLLSFAPYALWQGVLFFWLGEVGFGSGGYMSTPFELIPYMGFWRIYFDTGSAKAFLIFGAVLFPVVVLPSIWGIIRVISDFVKGYFHPFSFMLLVNAAVIAIMPFSTFRELLGITRVIPGLVIAWLLYASHFRRDRMLRYSLIWLATFALIVSGG